MTYVISDQLKKKNKGSVESIKFNPVFLLLPDFKRRHDRVTHCCHCTVKEVSVVGRQPNKGGYVLEINPFLMNHALANNV